MMNEQHQDTKKKSGFRRLSLSSFLRKHEKRCKEHDVGESRENVELTHPRDRDRSVDRRLALSRVDCPVFSSERIIDKSSTDEEGTFLLEVEKQRGIRSKSCPDVFVETSFEVSQFKREMRKINTSNCRIQRLFEERCASDLKTSQRPLLNVLNSVSVDDHADAKVEKNTFPLLRKISNRSGDNLVTDLRESMSQNNRKTAKGHEDGIRQEREKNKIQSMHGRFKLFRRK